MRTHPRRIAALAAATALALSAGTVGPLSSPASAVETAGAEIARAQGLEKFALRLLNCNRTGGKIRRDGTCKGRGSGRFSPYRRPLQRHKPIGTSVAWPWARAMADRDECSHWLAGLPDLPARLKQAGYPNHTWGENIACYWGSSARDMVIWASRAFQAEKKVDGGHWRNLKSRDFKSVGIGVAKVGSTSTIVFDFYGRRAP